MVEEERKFLEDVGRTPYTKVMEDLICYELNELSLNHFFLVGSNVRQREIIEFLKQNIKIFA